MFESNKDVSSRSGGSMSAFGGFSMMPNSSPSLSYEGKLIPNHKNPSLSENKISLSVPAFKNNKNHLSFTTQASILHLNQNITLSSNVIIPKNLYRTELGSHYMHFNEDKSNFGIRSSIGYNSDKLFLGSRDLSYSLVTHYGFPKSENSNWALTLYFSNNGPFGNYIPIPGFIYFYRTSTFTGIFGLPFMSMQWTPATPWTYSLSLFGLNLNLEAAYGTVEHLQYLYGINFQRNSFMLHNRVNEKDRLNFEEKKIFFGIRSPLFNTLASEFQFGEAFGRKITIGNKMLNTSGGSAEIKSSFYVNWSLKIQL
jgi:hypothetical protein